MPQPISNINPKGPRRGGNCPRMTKEGPKLLGGIAEDRHVLGELVSWKGNGNTPSKAALPVILSEGTSVRDSYGSMVKKQL